MITKSDDAPCVNNKFDHLGGLTTDTIVKLLSYDYYVSMFNRTSSTCEICFTLGEIHVVVYTCYGKSDHGMVEFRPDGKLWKCIAIGQLQFELSDDKKLFELLAQAKSQYKLWVNEPGSKLSIDSSLIC